MSDFSIKNKIGAELLAPGGSYESAIAAYNAGADAVYIGGPAFSARAGAHNPDTDNLIRLIDYAHIHDRKLYLTVNTLLKENEISDRLGDFMTPLYEEGLDAVIVQDYGVMNFMLKNFPGLFVHTSTQMTVMGEFTASFLKNIGIKRITLPRELSLDEISNIKNKVDIELEAFVHGALCYCYSGQCFMSSSYGERSGNRGWCAQPCRMEYDVYFNNRLQNRGNSKYVLSPKDISALNLLPQILEAGINSLKIEGRMKKPEYIAGVTSVYRKYLDMALSGDKYVVSKEDHAFLYNLFNRHGFSESYFKQHNGPSMISMKKPEFRTIDKKINDDIKKEYINARLKRTVDIDIMLRRGQPFRLSGRICGETVVTEGAIPQDAETSEISREELIRRVKKTGETNLKFNIKNIVMDDGLFVPVKSLNNTRRKFCGDLEQHVVNLCKRSTNRGHIKPESTSKTLSCFSENVNKKNVLGNMRYTDHKRRSPSISVSVMTKEQLDIVMKAEFVKDIYVDYIIFSCGNIYEILETAAGYDKNIYMAMPDVFRYNDIKIFKNEYLDILMSGRVCGVLVRNLEEYFYLKSQGFSGNYIFDHNVYSFNGRAAEFLLGLSGGKITAPIELSIYDFKRSGAENFEYIVYGHMPLMTTANCVMKTLNKCSNNNQRFVLNDRKGRNITGLCRCKFCYNILYNAVPISLFSHAGEIKGCSPDSLRLSFTMEEGSRVKEILEKSRRAFVMDEKISDCEDSTRGHFKKSVL